MKKKTSVRKYVIIVFCSQILMGLLFFVAMGICLKQGRFAMALVFSVPSIVMISVACNAMMLYNLLVSAGLLSPGSSLVPLLRRQAGADAFTASKEQKAGGEGKGQ